MLRTISEHLSPAPGRLSFERPDRALSCTLSCSFEEGRLSATSVRQNGNMPVDMIVVEETTFVN